MSLGLVAHRVGRRHLLFVAAVMMVATGTGFAALGAFWPLLLVAVLGTLNPSAGDVSLFLPLEHAVLADNVLPRERTALFARYSLAGALAGALGSLAASLPEPAAALAGVELAAALKAAFLLYALIGIVVFLLYRRLPPLLAPAGGSAAEPLGRSRRIVYLLTALFSLDSFGGGFLVQSLLALWLFERFELSLAAAAAIFFWSGVLSAFSFPLAARLARRVGLVNTMVWTHLPANCFLVLTPFAPSLGIAILLLLMRAALSSMDVPARTSYVMAVVTPAERAAAASVTNVPRSLASAASPLLAGWLLQLSPFGWPLVVGGALKIVYDLSLLFLFRAVKPPEERERV
jgi:MFS family permease